MPDTELTIAAVTRDQLRGAVGELHALADKLDAFRAGDSTAWTDQDTLTGHALLTIIQSHTTVTRGFRATLGRVDTVIRLDDRR